MLLAYLCHINIINEKRMENKRIKKGKKQYTPNQTKQPSQTSNQRTNERMYENPKHLYKVHNMISSHDTEPHIDFPLFR